MATRSKADSLEKNSMVDHGETNIVSIGLYRVCGLAVTAGISMKFDTAHGRWRPRVGGAKCIDSYGRKGVPRPPVILVLLSKN